MTYIFESGLAHHIEGLIQQKRADGYAYNSEEKLLKRFDTFCVQNYPELTTVTYEMAAKWSEARHQAENIMQVFFLSMKIKYRKKRCRVFWG